MEEKAVANRLIEESVTKIFFRYLVPSLIGMMLMSVNIVIDGIFVGNVVGSVALAAVNVATPVFSAFLGISLWIGIGGGALYSMALGKDNVKQAQSVFTQSIIVVLVTVVVISIILGFNLENIAMLLGANSETLPYVKEYLTVIVTFGFIMALENSLSIFVRNDGNPNLAMVSLITMAVSNIVLNYFMIFQWELGVRGAALATIIASLLGLLILLFHFLRKDSLLRLIPVRIKFSNMKETMAVGLPSFASEIGLAVFTIGYNVAMVSALGTVGVAAFSIVNYLHSVMLLAFMGLASAIQPMISFYYGGKHKSRIYQAVSIAEKTAVVIGAFILLIGFIEAQLFVNLFGEMGSDRKSVV